MSLGCIFVTDDTADDTQADDAGTDEGSSSTTDDDSDGASDDVDDSTSAADSTATSSSSAGPGSSTSARPGSSTSGGDATSWATSGVDTSGDLDSTTLDPDSSTSSNDTVSTGDPGDADAMCARWTADRTDMSEGDWSGSIQTCDPGDISDQGRQNALRLFNAYRWLAELPEVSDADDLNEQAQACAIIQHATGQLSHDPPPSAECWSEVGATASGRSNISSGPGVMSVDMYMVDWGNADTLGHRRWILSNSAGPIGLGSTSESSCMHILGGEGNANEEWIAYPPPGPFPFDAIRPLRFGDSLNETGWSIQSDSIDLDAAQVTVTSDGATMPMTVRTLLPGYGSRYAISLIPQGWTMSADVRYHVEVTGISTPISYDFDVVDCTTR